VKGTIRSWIAGIAGLIAAIAVSVLLYQKTRVADVGDRAEVMSQVRELQRWSALVSRETLAARYGLVPYYDSLTRANGEMTRAAERLRADLLQVSRTRPALSDGIAEVSSSVEERRGKVERFKSENSVLRNSLYYLPLAARDFAKKLEGDGAERKEEIRRAMTAVVESTLVFNLIRSDAGREQNAASLTVLEQLHTVVPEALRGDFDLFLLHAKTVLRQHDVVNPLTSQIIGSPLDAQIGRLERAYVAEVEASLARADRYRIGLYAWSVLLLIAVIMAGYKLRQVYANLEHLVRARTQELAKALSELWGEMELAKRIQTALVPSAPKLDGCDVAATMRPAAQVGGDYYDVMSVDGVEWILIGDVSGHGVPAGLVMMMFQTAVRTTLQANPRMEPNELLALVNRALTSNIRRLGENKYMTVSALRRVGNGGFHFAGLHQDLLVFRAGTGRVEAIETRGTWLGIDENIGDLLDVQSFDLARGDAVLLFTDGLTESTKDDCILDNGGLTSAFQQNGKGAASEILEGVLAVLEGRTVADDVSAIVIKQL
jgi:serine phosphatase RsbU (regulator of sigma subunit)